MAPWLWYAFLDTLSPFWSSTYTKQLSLNGNIGANIKGRVFQIMWNLHFELTRLATSKNKIDLIHKKYCFPYMHCKFNYAMLINNVK